VIFLAAAVVIVGALCLLDLLLTFGVIRRLREHDQMIVRPPQPAMPTIGLAPSEPVGAFSATTTGGELLSGADGLRVAAFFSSSCSVCPERVGPFVDYLTEHLVARDSALSVVVGADGGPPPYLDRLAEVTKVCVEQDDSEITKAFKILGFPAFCLLGTDGTVVAASYDPAMLPEPALAP